MEWPEEQCKALCKLSLSTLQQSSSSDQLSVPFRWTGWPASFWTGIWAGPISGIHAFGSEDSQGVWPEFNKLVMIRMSAETLSGCLLCNIDLYRWRGALPLWLWICYAPQGEDLEPSEGKSRTPTFGRIDCRTVYGVDASCCSRTSSQRREVHKRMVIDARNWQNIYLLIELSIESDA